MHDTKKQHLSHVTELMYLSWYVRSISLLWLHIFFCCLTWPRQCLTFYADNNLSTPHILIDKTQLCGWRIKDITMHVVIKNSEFLKHLVEIGNVNFAITCIY